MDIGEFDLIEQIKARFPVPAGVMGIGDDCAALPQREGRETLVTTDMLMEGVHFLMEDASAYDLGWKSAAVNISDIAGMGGRPEGSFLSFALPKSLSAEWLNEFFDGYQDCSERFGCPLLGGDTTSSLDRLCINVAVLGSCETGKSRKRSDARPGDIICTTGPIGDSGTGLKVILGGIARGSVEQELVRRHYRPVPRVEAGLELAATEGVHAMMDISDGVGSDLRHILKASGVGAQVDTRALPMSDGMLQVCKANGWDPVHIALDGGEDYELLFTAAQEALDSLSFKYFPIGKIVAGQGVEWLGGSEDYVGFRHF